MDRDELEGALREGADGRIGSSTVDSVLSPQMLQNLLGDREQEDWSL